MQKFKFLRVTHTKNGDIDPIEIDGVKYEPNPDKPDEVLLDNAGNKVPFKDNKGGGDKQNNPPVDLSKLSVDDIAKANPEFAKIIESAQQVLKDKERIEAEAKAKADKEAEEKGDWQKLANERADKIKNLEKELGQKDEVLTKYKGSLQKVLDEAIQTIPEENRGLIPEKFSPREKLEYIAANAKLLGAKSFVNIGDGKTPPNEEPPVGTKEQELIKEFEVLQKKQSKTQVDYDKMQEIAKEIKKVRAEKGK